LIPITWAAEPLVQLVVGGAPKQVPAGENTQGVVALLEKAGRSPRGLRIMSAARADHVAFFADVSGMFGLIKRHALGVARLGQSPAVLGTLAIGRWDNGKWS
jgi:hypothetical protein